jgi:hypothetical protein
MAGTAIISWPSGVRMVTTVNSRSFIRRNRSRAWSTGPVRTIRDDGARGRLRAPRARGGRASGSTARCQDRSAVRPEAGSSTASSWLASGTGGAAGCARDRPQAVSHVTIPIVSGQVTSWARQLRRRISPADA